MTDNCPGHQLCSVHYASVNFRDVMLATGKLSRDAIPGEAGRDECMLGMEFSGKTENGDKVMGILPVKGLATTVSIQTNFLWSVPVIWSLQEAATIPLAYTTAYYALVVRGKICHGDTILIHSGSGAVGQAAIDVALNYGCDVYTTVGTPDKKEYLITKFKDLNVDHIFHSRNTSFENDVMEATHGRGVDIVLNSLTDDKLKASLRVLAQHGRFLEIGKVDLSNNTAFGMAILLKNVSIHGILLDALFEAGNREWKIVYDLLQDGIQSGVVKPLRSTVFGHLEVEHAFRYLAQGKHIGKVLIRISEDDSKTVKSVIHAQARAYFHPRKCYIITGGLGGFGLELAHWLVERGARYIVLTSRTGIKTGYQSRKVKRLQDHGVEVTVSVRNICNEDDARCLLTDTKMPTGGVFHLAVVQNARLLENHDAASFQEVCDSKVTATMNLDKITREQCKESCDWFVVFSSVISARGEIGQSNYAYANSVMERICEKRKRDRFPGLAIQWGPVGDVGLLRDMYGNNETIIAGTVPQRIDSCLKTLDILLNQTEPVVSSWIYLENNQQSSMHNTRESTVDLVHTIFNILGIIDLGTVNPTTTLGDLGLDSLMVVEVRQTLERRFDISMSIREIRELSVNKLRDISTSRKSE